MLPSRSEQDTWVGVRELSEASIPWVRDHRVDEAVVMPGTGILDLALQVSGERNEVPHTAIRNVEFVSDLTFSGEPLLVETRWRSEDAGSGAFELSRFDELSSDWSVVARCRLTNDEASEGTGEFPDWLTELSPMQAEEVYATAAERGIQYGPTFQCIQSLWHLERETLAHCVLPSDTPTQAFRGRLHPALWDSVLQAALPTVQTDGPVVPVAIDAIHWLQPDEDLRLFPVEGVGGGC